MTLYLLRLFFFGDEILPIQASRFGPMYSMVVFFSCGEKLRNKHRDGDELMMARARVGRADSSHSLCVVPKNQEFNSTIHLCPAHPGGRFLWHFWGAEGHSFQKSSEFLSWPSDGCQQGWKSWCVEGLSGWHTETARSKELKMKFNSSCISSSGIYTRAGPLRGNVDTIVTKFLALPKALREAMFSDVCARRPSHSWRWCRTVVAPLSTYTNPELRRIPPTHPATDAEERWPFTWDCSHSATSGMFRKSLTRKYRLRL